MTHISKIFSVEDLQQHIEDGWVRTQVSPEKWGLKYTIYNYTERTVFAKHWNPITMWCRGLILDADMNIVARSYKKFYNYGEGRLEIDDTMPVEVTDKIDGSLGILYSVGWYDGPLYRIATRGSFMSDQAVHASDLWYDKYEDVYAPEGFTFLFEICYAQNRIVIDYHGMDDLVLLGAVNIEHGYYIGPHEAAGMLNWPGPITQVFPAKTIAEAFAMPPRENAEGVVVRSGNKITKIKQVDYVELHKIVTGTTARTVWECLSAGRPLSTMLEIAPDELTRWIDETAQDLQDEFSKITTTAVDEFVLISNIEPRSAFAAEAKKTTYPDLAFLLKDGKSISESVWKKIRPAADKPFNFNK